MMRLEQRLKQGEAMKSRISFVILAIASAMALNGCSQCSQNKEEQAPPAAATAEATAAPAASPADAMAPAPAASPADPNAAAPAAPADGAAAPAAGAAAPAAGGTGK